MQIALPNNPPLEAKESLYTDEEMHLLHQMENGLIKTKSHEEVMDNLRLVLKLDEV